MISVATIALQPGMELAEDAVSLRSGVICPAHTKLDQNAIDKLKRYQIMVVTVMEPEDYTTSHYEKIACSRAFKSFAEQYHTQLNAYKYMINDFMEGRASINTNLLLTVYHSLYDNVGDGDLLLDMLYSMLPSEDNVTYAHCLNAALIAGVFASWLDFDENDSNLMILSGFLYDIGKLKLPDKLIWKVGRLTDFEFNWMKTHTTIGYDLLKNQPLDQHIINAALMHHERDDGTGYPNKLKGDAIDRYAKYMAIVDGYDAMTSARSYRNSLNPFQVITNFERGGLYQYDLSAVKRILMHIAAHQVGHVVTLNDEQASHATVRMVNPDNLSRPIIETDNGIVDMREFPKMEIVAIL
ncbi:MAG: HD domain-containing protein [Clostridium sp.]|nr:HD domain-containing protein [Clostridium sp.]